MTEREKLVRKFDEYLREIGFPESFDQRWGKILFGCMHEAGKIKLIIKDNNQTEKP
jgi:hypothetical protein